MATTKDAARLMAEAQMIGADARRGDAVVLTCEAPLDQPADQVAAARLLATAHGIYEARVNGVPTDDALLKPGWTSYEWRLQVQEADVTDQVRRGAGTVRIDALLGNGWWRGGLGFGNAGVDYGDELGFIAVLEVAFADGARQTIATAPDAWQAHTSAIVENSLYNGETIDLRRAAAPLAVRAVPFDRATLIAQEKPAVRRQGVVHPQRIWASPTGKTLVDFGQNLVGWLRVRVQGPAGTEVVIRHAEVLEHGELGTRPLRAARATDRFILSGGEDVFEPTFTFHGFRYAEVTGWPGALEPDALEAVVISSEMRRTGWFACSDEDVNQLVENSRWGQRGNFVDIPTDCPQRDERLGWTGDIAAYAPTAAFQYDCARLLGSWVRDLIAEAAHAPRKLVPFVVPDALKLAGTLNNVPEELASLLGETAIWGDAAVWVPQALWHAYGDERALADQYPAIRLHLEAVERVLTDDDLWMAPFQFGDWLDPDAPPENPAAAKADPAVVAQACLYRSVRFAAEAAGVLGFAEERAHWNELARRVRVAFQRAYVEGGTITSDAPTVYALALVFGLLDEDDVSAAAERLAKLVRDAGYRVSTGFAGTPYVTWALSENGYVGDAYRLLLERGCPSWLYPVSMGATTIWERWDSMLPDGSINPGEMTSFNHYALGAVCDWIYQVVGGIRPAAPGYARVLVKPQPGPGITWARCAHDAPCGRIEVSWRVRTDEGASWFQLEVELPAAVPACVELPDGSRHEVRGGAHRFGCALARE